jgi:hypothetical protein
MKNKALLFAILPLLLISCAGTQTASISQKESAKLAGASVYLSHGPMPPFQVMTAGKVAGMALTGMVAGIASGNSALGTQMTTYNMQEASQRNETQLSDPAPYIAAQLGEQLKSSKGARTSPSSTLVKSDRPNAITKAAAGYDYALDVRTLGWTGVYMPLNWLKYRFIYASRCQLIETKTNRVVASSDFFDRGDDVEPVNYDEFTKNNYERVRGEVKKHEAASKSLFATKVLGL